MTCVIPLLDALSAKNAVTCKNGVLGLINKDDSVSILVNDSSSGYLITEEGELSLAEGEYMSIIKTCAEIYAPGGNVFFRIAKNNQNGLVTVYTIGLVRYNRKWKLEQTTMAIQLYRNADGALFTPFLTHQPKLAQALMNIVADDKTVPAITELAPFTPEMDTVQWVDIFRRIGMIASKDGDVMFYWGDCERGHEGCFKAGTKVAFIPVPCKGSFALKATHVTYVE